jgi:hypothetical protein
MASWPVCRDRAPPHNANQIFVRINTTSIASSESQIDAHASGLCKCTELMLIAECSDLRRCRKGVSWKSLVPPVGLEPTLVPF